MLASFLLALREGLEASLIIGIVLGVLKKMDRRYLFPAIWKGTLLGVIVSILGAVGLNLVGAEFEGRGEQIFEGITMLFAAGVLTWVVFWLKKQTGSLKEKVETEADRATVGLAKRGLFLLAFLVVVREGIELALFLFAARLVSNPFEVLIGAGLGIALAILLGWLIFRSAHQLSLARFFQVTNILLALFAAGLVGIAVHEFNELGWIPAIIDPLWNLNSFIANESTVGQILKALVGYDSSPSLTQVIGYAAYLGILAVIYKARKQK